VNSESKVNFIEVYGRSSGQLACDCKIFALALLIISKINHIERFIESSWILQPRTHACGC